MITQFRKFTFLNVAILLPFTLILCLAALFNLPAEGFRITAFEPAILNLIGTVNTKAISPQNTVLIGAGLTFLQGLYLNKTVNKYILLGRASFLPALLYVSLSSMLMPFLALSPALICNFLLIGMIDKLSSIYYRADSLSAIFDLGLIIAIGTLIYFPFIAMLLLLWISLLIFKPFNWREWIAGLLGFCTVYFLVFVIYLWLDKLSYFYSIWLPLTHPFPSDVHFDTHDYLVLVMPVIILGLFIISLRQNFYKSIVHIRKTFQLLFFIFLLALASSYLSPFFKIEHFLLCVPPISIYMAYYFNAAKIKWLYESAFALMILGFIYFQWF